MPLFFFQCGDDFYDDQTGELVVSYPGTCSHSFDVDGAKAARARFLSEYPHYVERRDDE